MDNDTYIKYISYYLPKTSVSVDEIFDKSDIDMSGKGISKKDLCNEFKDLTKLDKISVFDSNDDIISIVSDMISELFEKSKIDPSDIDYFVCANDVLLHYKDISIMHYIRKKFTFNNAVILPILQPCTASLFGMGLSGKLLTRKNKYMLIISANIWPRTIDRWPSAKSRFMDFTVMGDGIGLMLIGNDGGEMKITNWNCYNYGNTSFNSVSASNEMQKVLLNRMDMINKGASFIKDSLKKQNLEFDDIEKVIQPNVRHDVYFNMYSKLLKIDTEMFFFDNIPNGGHISDIDIIRNLKDYIQINKRTEKEYLLLYSIDIEPSLDLNYHLVTLKRNK